MLLTGLLFVGLTAVVKHVGQDLPAAQAAFLRFLFGTILLLPAIRAIRRTPLDRRTLRLFALRGVLHSGAVALWFFAMARIPLTDVTAMNYLSPIFVGLGAALLLGERLPKRRIAAVAAALVGVAIVLRPGVREVTTGHLVMLVMPILSAGSYLVAKRLSSEVPAVVIVGALSVSVTVALAPVALLVWEAPSLSQTGWLVLVAALATAGHYAMTRAFAAAPVSATQPVTFLQLIWAALLGWAVFGEAVDPFVVLGGTLIVAAVSYDAWREGRSVPAR
jgi:drug/metabolite transporter (DMT)-like permease